MTSDELKELEKSLWQSADTLRANSDLKSSEYSTPVLGLIFLKFADNKYRQHEQAILDKYLRLKGGRRERKLSEIAIEQCGFYLPEHARYGYLLNLPEEEEVDKKIKQAMEAIEEYKPELDGVLPKDEYARLTRTDTTIPSRLLRNFDNIPDDADGDMFGQIYEYFLGEFALAEGQGGGQFFTPKSVVRLMVEIIEPHQGTVFDPACGSGGMFVQSAKFIDEHRSALEQGAADAIFVYGQEKTLETVKLAKMNLAVNGLRGDVQQANTYYEDPFGALGKFDYVLANPPFNVDDVNLSRVENDERFNTYGVPRKKSKAKKKDAGNETVPNANYLWINLFVTSLNKTGRAGLVMANSASDARHSEADIRKTLIEENLIYAMITLPSNMFYTVTLPATLWFFDKNKADDLILFIDARNIFTQIDRAHREFSEAQINNIAIISRLHRGQRDEFVALVDQYFASGMEALGESVEQVERLLEQLESLLDEDDGKAAIDGLRPAWQAHAGLTEQYRRYTEHYSPLVISSEARNLPPNESLPHDEKISLPAGRRNDKGSQDVISTKARNPNTIIDAHNTAQHELHAAFGPFFDDLRAATKALNRTLRSYEQTQAQTNGHARSDRETRAAKAALDVAQADAQKAETWFTHIGWLHERFPNAAYEDVTGLCKLATPAEVAEQDYSLNPGRYVGVVIEDDGKTAEEFAEEILRLNAKLEELNNEASSLEAVISHNIRLITDE